MQRRYEIVVYEEIKCRKCGKPIRFAEEALWIRCVYCGAEYTRAKQKEKSGKIQRIGEGGNILFEAFIPSGWTYHTIEDGSFSLLAPVCIGLELTGPGGVQITFLPFAYYKDSAVRANPFFPQSVPGEQFDGMSLVRYRKRVALPQYTYERITTMTKTTQLRIEPMDHVVLNEKTAQFRVEASQKLQGNVLTEQGKFRVQVFADGRNFHGYFATVQAYLDQRNQTGADRGRDFLKKGMAFLGAMYGIGGMASHDWGKAFDALLLAPDGDTKEYEPVFDEFIRTFAYGPLYFALQEAERRKTEQIQINGAMQRQQNAIRSSQQISRTLSETSDIVNQACQDRSARMDRVWEKNSEAIRGVNAYTDSTGRRYEADVAYDHVYRRGDDTLAGSKNGSVDLGPEWEELKKKF